MSTVEKWDIYDKNRVKTGKIALRGKPLSEGEYHLVVFAIIRINKDEFLISKRAPEKTNGGTWEFNGGSAVAGDSSLQAILREVEEETGIKLKSNGKVVDTYMIEDYASFIVDVWYFEEEVDLKECICQPGEVTEIRSANASTILEMYDKGEFMPGGINVMKTFKETLSE